MKIETRHDVSTEMNSFLFKTYYGDRHTHVITACDEYLWGNPDATIDSFVEWFLSTEYASELRESDLEYYYKTKNVRTALRRSLKRVREN